MNDIIPIEVDFAINKDNLHLLGEPHQIKEVINNNIVKEKRIWKLKEKMTHQIILLEVTISYNDIIHIIELYLPKGNKYSNCHFSYGPAYLFYQKGNLSEATWYIKGLKHSEEGPADVSYDLKTGTIYKKKFYISGVMID